MDYKKIGDDELLQSLEEHFVYERNNAHHILLHLKEIQSRHLYAKRGFSNLFWMLIKYYRQSETSANQRIKALALIMDVPIIEERLITGELNMSTLAMAQRQIKREEKLTGKTITNEKKSEIVEAITNKTMAQTEVELFKQLPETASHPENTARRVSQDSTRLGLTVPDDVLEMMAQLKDIWAHVDPDMDHVEIMRRAFKLALEKLDPTKQRKTQSATESVKHRSNDRITYYGKEHDRALWERGESKCEYIDKQSGRKCDCTFGLQREHVIPLGKGGTNELSNMQLLCRAHNQLRAREEFGDEKINRFQKTANKSKRSG